ncbi:hypothetical protein E2C01_086100 [Portunus trituberculatus]|uniref:Uncharacterized protein n=1 Tax=Portunus trituberculatus TaxID=210409 RepID=A0A5B7J8R9_PORTR|nr:hypothetical protein [Portunus trituberculatus]
MLNTTATTTTTTTTTTSSTSTTTTAALKGFLHRFGNTGQPRVYRSGTNGRPVVVHPPSAHPPPPPPPLRVTGSRRVL